MLDSMIAFLLQIRKPLHFHLPAMAPLLPLVSLISSKNNIKPPVRYLHPVTLPFSLPTPHSRFEKEGGEATEDTKVKAERDKVKFMQSFNTTRHQTITET